MAQEAATRKRNEHGRSFALLRGLAAFLFVAGLGFGGYQVFMHPDTPLPPHWNPTQPLLISDPVTPLTGWKLNRATAAPESCLAALDGFVAAGQLTDLEDNMQCHIRDRVELRGVGSARIDAVETRCTIALRMAMWERHSLQPAAQNILGTAVQGIDHFGSYSCRTMRTGAGLSTRMSTHATADAIDVSGFRFSNGKQINLQQDWDGSGPEAAFLRAARDGACDWFRVTLSPEYNNLHADHFHLQSMGWGLCR